MSNVDASGATPAERIHALDAVRGGALALGVAFHASLSFLPGPQLWVVRDTPSWALGVFFFVTHMFRMTLFFLIAGYFGRLLLERRGVSGFIRNRVVRILSPMLAFWPLVFGGIVACFIWGAAVMSRTSAGNPPPAAPLPTLATFPLTHLWFLYVLLWLYAGALALCGLVAFIDRSGRFRERLIDPTMRRVLATPLAAALPALPVALGLMLYPVWYVWGGVPTPDTGFVPNAAALTTFAIAFGFGWLVQRQRVLLEFIERRWRLQLALAAVLTCICLWYLGSAPVLTPIGDGAKPLMAIAYALAIWTWTLGLLGAAMRFLSKDRPGVRYLADASYWIYLVHLPVVAGLQVMVFSWPLPAVLKWVVVTAGAFAILLGSYQLIVRRSWIGKWLNGRRYPAQVGPHRARATMARGWGA